MAKPGRPDGRAEARCFLPRHVFLCPQGRYMVFLDLRADRYFAVETAGAEAVFARIEGWPGEAAPTPAASEEQRIERLTRSLVDQGLLTRDAATGKAMATAAGEPPEDDLMDIGLEPGADGRGEDGLRGVPPIRARDVARFLAAITVAWVACRTLSLERLVRYVARRRAKHGTDALDPQAARRCAAVYARLRPFFLTARDACLFESFAFLEYAARQGLYPGWVFGVQATPFAAHCWVQQGRLVLNDHAEHAAAFAPIMRV